MVEMIIKMSLVTIIYVTITIILWLLVHDISLKRNHKIAIGIVYGIISILSTHFGINYVDMLLNVRDMGPLIAGLFFDPLSGIIAGLIGGIERYIAGEFWNVGYFSRIACSVSTCLAGFLSYFLSDRVFRKNTVTPVYAFFIGAVMEVFHMYVILITHRDDIFTAYNMVDICSGPMIIFNAIGMALTGIVIQSLSGKWENPFVSKPIEKISVSKTFQQSLFLVMTTIMLINIAGVYLLQSQTAKQNAIAILDESAEIVKKKYEKDKNSLDAEDLAEVGFYLIYNKSGKILHGYHINETLSVADMNTFDKKLSDEYFDCTLFGTEFLAHVITLDENHNLFVAIPTINIYWYRKSQTYEITFAYILLFATVYSLITVLVNQIVIKKIELINGSLEKITNGNLNEVVNVRSSSEFASLSDDINETVDTLKRYIGEAKKRIEQELELAATIQKSSLPTNFIYPGHNEFDLYAIMNAAKEVGGDFYDFFFVSATKMALVIADVTGKGIPAALFMMRAKTAIRTYAQTLSTPTEILSKVNAVLCEGNDAQMFVTTWIGIIDLKTGKMVCANAGHEYPVIYRKDEGYILYQDEHVLPLATYDGIIPKEYEIDMKPGDRIFVYTDGIPEAINLNNEQYGTDRLLKVLNDNTGDDLSSLLANVRNDVEKFANGAEQFDDITILEFRFTNYG